MRTFRSWWKGFTHARAESRSPQRPAWWARLGVESLEDRRLLSTSIPLSSSHWTPLGPAPILGTDRLANPATGRISAIAADPTNPNVIYVGAASGGVWKTTNAGQTWFPLTDSQATLNIGSIALAPSNHNILYVGTGEGNFSGDIGSDTIPGQGVLKSTDGGNSWTLLGQSQFAGKSISAIVVNPTNPNTVYLTVDWGSPAGIWRSLDGGITWTNVALPGASMTALVMDPTNSQILYAAAGWFHGNSFNGVYRSTDGGTTWSFAGNFPTNSSGHVGRISLAIAPSAPAMLYAAIADPSNGQQVYQVMKTTNANTPNAASISWVSVGNAATFGGDQLFHGQGFYGNVITVDPFNANDVFVAGYKVWQSTNGGGSWTKDPNTPLKIHDDQHALTFLLPNDPNNHTLLVGTDGGIYRLDNPGNFTFSNLNGTGLQITQFYHIGLDPTTADIAFGASQDNGVEKFNNGATWTNELCCDGYNVEVSATNHSRIYANQNGTFLRSDNGGANYTAYATPNGSRSDLYTLDPNNGDRILMGGNAVYESTNAGVNWTPRNGAGWPANATVEAIAVAPTTPNMIYVIASANGSTGTYVTTNDGLTWAHYNSPGNDSDFWSTGLQVDPLNNQVAYALNHSAGRVYRTTNGGQTWSNITGNLPAETSFSLAVKANGPADRDHVLYVGNDTGVYATCNMGGTWSRVSTGLPNAHVTHVEVLSNLNVLAAGTYGRGLWELQIGVVAQVQNSTLNISGDDCDNIITVQSSPAAPGLNVWEGNSSTPYYHLVGSFPAASFSQIVLTDGNGHDTINIEDTLSGKPLTVNLGNGGSVVNVSPFANNLDHIQGNVSVNGGNGPDTLNIDDQNKATSLTYALNNATWSRPGAAVISSGTLFADIHRVVVNAGSGQNVYNVTNTTTLTTLNTGSGQGFVNVRGTASRLTVDTPAGTGTSSQTVRVGNAGSVQAIAAALTIHNQPARDTLMVDDIAGPVNQPNNVVISASGITGLAPAPINFTSFSISNLSLGGGTGSNNTYNITGIPALSSMLFNTGNGGNIVNIQATSAPLTVDSNPNDVINLVNSMHRLDPIGQVTVNAPAGTGTVTADDTGYNPGGETYTVTASTFTIGRPSFFQLTYNGIAGLVLSASATGGNVINVQGTGANTALAVSTGPNDAVDLTSTSNTLNPIGAVTINDGTGTSSVLVDDSGYGGSDTYTVTGSTVMIGRSSTFSLTYNGIGALTLNGGSSGETYLLDSTSVPTTVNGGAGANCFHVDDPSSGQYLAADILGPVTLNGSGADVLDFFDASDPNAETFNFDNVPSMLTLGSNGVTIATFGGMGGGIYVVTNGFSTPNDQSGTVIFDPAGGPPCLPGGGPSAGKGSGHQAVVDATLAQTVGDGAITNGDGGDPLIGRPTRDDTAAGLAPWFAMATARAGSGDDYWVRVSRPTTSYGGTTTIDDGELELVLAIGQDTISNLDSPAQTGLTVPLERHGQLPKSLSPLSLLGYNIWVMSFRVSPAGANVTFGY